MRIIAAPFIEPTHRFSQIACAANEGNGENSFVHMELFVGGCEDLALIDEIHFQSLEHLRFGKMSDAALGHHGNGHRFLYCPYHCRVRHPRDAAVFADVRLRRAPAP